ncbi:MAG: hypothetical protein QHH75_09505 [Bacillota bacterium]|nr:hypothetical protein [Bacillota bacterium]
MVDKRTSRVQGYPRKSDDLLDESYLQPHMYKPIKHEMQAIIIDAIRQANKKSSREILKIPDGVTAKQLTEIYRKAGKALFNYFKKTYADPASTAYYYLNKHYSVIGRELFKNKALHDERMNAGWRYQYIAKGAALVTQRFQTISDIGSSGTDFTATIAMKGSNSETLSIYASVKNRSSTISGSNWPKAIQALEETAKRDINRIGPYICVFCLTMEKGNRVIKVARETNIAYSLNVEVWPANFFWPFFTNHSYEEVVKTVMTVLPDVEEQDSLGVDVPGELLESFGEHCKAKKLVDDNGYFNNPERLVEFFVRGSR